MPARFPARRPDGSFDVVAVFGDVAGDERATSEWIRQWNDAHTSWCRVWSAATAERKQVLLLQDEFSEPPAFDGLRGGELRVRFRGRPSATLWKDWLVKFAEDFLMDHAGSRLIGFE